MAKWRRRSSMPDFAISLCAHSHRAALVSGAIVVFSTLRLRGKEEVHILWGSYDSFRP